MTALQCNAVVSGVILTDFCIQIVPSMPDTAVVVVGDTHGQLHDVCSM